MLDALQIKLMAKCSYLPHCLQIYVYHTGSKYCILDLHAFSPNNELVWSRMNVTESSITGARWDRRLYLSHLHPANQQYLQITFTNLTRVVPLFIWKKKKKSKTKQVIIKVILFLLIIINTEHTLQNTVRVQLFELIRFLKKFLKGTYGPQGCIIFDQINSIKKTVTLKNISN